MPVTLPHFPCPKKHPLFPHPRAVAAHKRSLLCLLLVLAMVAGLTACGRKPANLPSPEDHVSYTYPAANPAWTDNTFPESAAPHPDLKEREKRLAPIEGID